MLESGKERSTCRSCMASWLSTLVAALHSSCPSSTGSRPAWRDAWKSQRHQLPCSCREAHHMLSTRLPGAFPLQQAPPLGDAAQQGELVSAEPTAWSQRSASALITLISVAILPFMRRGHTGCRSTKDASDGLSPTTDRRWCPDLPVVLSQMIVATYGCTSIQSFIPSKTCS